MKFQKINDYGTRSIAKPNDGTKICFEVSQPVGLWISIIHMT